MTRSAIFWAIFGTKMVKCEIKTMFWVFWNKSRHPPEQSCISDLKSGFSNKQVSFIHFLCKNQQFFIFAPHWPSLIGISDLANFSCLTSQHNSNKPTKSASYYNFLNNYDSMCAISAFWPIVVSYHSVLLDPHRP